MRLANHAFACTWSDVSTSRKRRDVIGFKGQGSTNDRGGLPSATPLVPLAVRTDYATNPPTDVKSWDHQVIFRNGSAGPAAFRR